MYSCKYFLSFVSGYINVRSEFDKELKLPSANDCYSHAQASVHYIWWQRWDRLREQPQGSRRSKYSTRGVVNDNQIGPKLQEIVNGPARSDVGRQQERRVHTGGACPSPCHLRKPSSSASPSGCR